MNLFTPCATGCFGQALAGDSKKWKKFSPPPCDGIRTKKVIKWQPGLQWFDGYFQYKIACLKNFIPFPHSHTFLEIMSHSFYSLSGRFCVTSQTRKLLSQVRPTCTRVCFYNHFSKNTLKNHNKLMLFLDDCTFPCKHFPILYFYIHFL